MSDINFLANKKADEADETDKSRLADKKEKIVWSEPEDTKSLPREAPFFALSLFKKKTAPKKPVAETPAAEPLPAIDRSKIRQMRQEILGLIKRQKNLESGKKHKKSINGGSEFAPSAMPTPRPASPSLGGGGGGVRPGKAGHNFFAGLLAGFKKQPSQREVLIDYQQVFNDGKNRGNQPARPASPASPEPKPVQPARSAQVKPSPDLPGGENGNKAAVPEPKPRAGFFSRFFKWIKDKISALGWFKTGPVKINLKEAGKIKPTAAPGPRPRPAEEKKAEVKIKETVDAEPATAASDAVKVLETNLIKGEIITFFDWRKESVGLIKAVLIPVFLVCLIYFGLVYYQKYNQTKIEAQARELNELMENIKQEEPSFKKIIEFQNRLSLVSKIFAKHIYWTNFFKFLEDNTIKDVFFQGFSGDTGGDYSLNAVASRFSDISEQVNLLAENPKITSVETAGGKLASGGVGAKSGVAFNLSFSILNSIFIE
ncbi:hypothetical protein A3H66_02490 [Candidatus Falkowbacteria bacterium RIFCSPLOWO2_02_FULL_45_21]|uniref:Uncharacterized protein n=1 Tax=Candidatus Falkowbacteria bacterium RIFCSPLOWO2_02_FULL_45_21 TaxID=1797989 RepID=A0A1F5SA75_9BACT|nr:MAG: hypothetical protein A3H66_02490 [Candidatus Falkowbacteria bacterium RIFCSPLOWO2_02_FULL_45_21]